MHPAFNQILKEEFQKGYAAGEAKKEAEVKEILRLLVEGKHNSEIARELDVDEDKVQHYRTYVEPAN